MLDKYFIPFDRSLKLKELGFDEPVDYYYTLNGEVKQSCGFFNYPKQIYPDYIKRPLFCQVFDWFRDKHDLDGFIKPNKGRLSYSFSINSISENSGVVFGFHQSSGYKKYNTYEEAQLACLDKLIEICEESSVS